MHFMHVYQSSALRFLWPLSTYSAKSWFVWANRITSGTGVIISPPTYSAYKKHEVSPSPDMVIFLVDSIFIILYNWYFTVLLFREIIWMHSVTWDSRCEWVQAVHNPSSFSVAVHWNNYVPIRNSGKKSILKNCRAFFTRYNLHFQTI